MRISILSILLFFSSSSFAHAATDFFTAIPSKIGPGEDAMLTWAIEGATGCESSVDYLNSNGVWVWTLSDPWHATSRPAKGSLNVRPEKSARYRLSCLVNAGIKEVTVIVTVAGQAKEKEMKPEMSQQSPSVTVPARQKQSPQPSESQFSGTGKSEEQPQKTPIKEEKQEKTVQTVQKEVKKIIEPPAPQAERRPEIKTPEPKEAKQLQSIPSDQPKTVEPSKSAKNTWNKEKERAARNIFLSVYTRVAVSSRKSDMKALRLLSGIETPTTKNKKAETTAAKTFAKLFKRKPRTKQDQLIIVALSYSGAPFLKDTDNDGLSDSDEKSYKSNPRKKDTDGDGYPDGAEVDHGYSPIKGKSIRL